MKLYARVAETLEWIDRCENAGNTEWRSVAESRLSRLLQHLPHGAGIDGDTIIRDIRWGGTDGHRKVTKIVFGSDFHHMDEYGGYDGWTEHNVSVTPGWDRPEISVSGRNRNDIKDYLWEAWNYALTVDTDTEGNTIGI